MIALFIALVVAQPDPDEVSTSLKRARTIEACRLAYGPAKDTYPTSSIRGVSAEAEQCTKRVMNAKVDELLLPLKSSNAEAFKQGMEVQRLFNVAVASYCGRWAKYYEACCVTCSFTEQPECGMAFHEVRVKQVSEFLSKKLVAPALPAKRKTTAVFQPFAAAWCAMLAGQGVLSLSCEADVLGGLEAGQSDDGAALSCTKRVRLP